MSLHFHRNLSSAPLSQPPTLSESDSIPGEAAEDGQLRRDYVLIDRKVVEFDRAVDGTYSLLALFI
jgi:hypothetical protein